MSNLLYLSFHEGFLKFELRQGERMQLVNIKGFTRDIRKASAITSEQQAVGIMKFALEKNASARKYCCILQPVMLPATNAIDSGVDSSQETVSLT